MTILTGDSVKQFESALAEQMEKSIKHFEHELLSIRSGKASAAMVQDLKVDSYGSEVKIKAVASISTPDSRLIIIQPWDKGILGEIVKSINNSDLGATPVIDGDYIRISLPIMSVERRDELVKVLKKRVEESRIRIRNVRREFNDYAKTAEKDRKISEDLCKRVSDSIQKTTDLYISKIDKIAETKEHELKLI